MSLVAGPKPKRRYSRTSNPARTEIPIDDGARKYIMSRWYVGRHSFVDFPSDVREKISESLDRRLQSGEIQRFLRLRNNGFYADAEVESKTTGYSYIRVTDVVEANPKL